MGHKVKLTSLVLDMSFHERAEINPDAVARYVEMYQQGKQNGLKVQRGTNKIIDGIHRYVAAKQAGVEEVYIDLIDVPDHELRAKAYGYNRRHGIPYSTAERNEVIWKLRRVDGWAVNEIAKLVGLDPSTVTHIITNCDSAHGYNPEEAATKAEAQPAIIRTLLRGKTQQAVADDYEVSQPRIATIWGDWKERAGELYESGLMKTETAEKLGLTVSETDALLAQLVKDNYEPINFEPVYSSWWPPFGIDKRYGQPYPGNIPAALVQNILYFYTRPGDHVLDPMTGGGVVLDVCNDMVGRTCEGFDLIPYPDRNDVKPCDLREGPPVCEKVPDFIFLDPPYGLVAKGKYTGHAQDLTNLPTEDFVSVWSSILTYWDQGRLAFLMAGMRRGGSYTDLPMLVGQAIENAGWTILGRIVNGIGQTASDSGFWESMERDGRLILHRHIDIWIAEKKDEDHTRT